MTVRLAVAALLSWSFVLVASARADEPFHRGVNLSHWFEVDGARPVDLAHMRMLKEAGFDHVRIPVDPFMIGWQRGAQQVALRVAPLRDAIDNALNAGLDVIVDIAPNADVRYAFESGGAGFDDYTRLCIAMAHALDDYPQSRVALELMNEPQFYDWGGRWRWPPLQARLVERVRAVAPQRTLIVTSRDSDGPEQLLELNPLPDSHLIYTFHFYFPYIFTHQGASWMRDNQHTSAAWFTHLAYPSEVARSSRPQLDAAAPEPRSAIEFDRYVDTPWDEAHIMAELAPLEEWARRHHVRVICDEFGVIRPNADPVSRYRYIHDVRTVLEKMNFGWTVWDYADDFGIAPTHAGSEAIGPIDQNAEIALGLKRSTP
jgi:endoglucanase